MKAKLKLVNVGQKIGEEYWEFNSGAVTEIRGRTASGKSRIIKSCALALSLPITSDEIRSNAISFGIARSDDAECSPLLNSNKDKAVIELKYDDILKRVELDRDGTEKINIPGNQKFLYSSMLVENSKIHNYIDRGIADFSWIVSEMSLAKDYEAVKRILISYSDLLVSKKEEIEKGNNEKIKNQELLEKRKKELTETNNRIYKIEKEIDAIEINPQLKTEYEEINNDLRKIKKQFVENKDKLKKHQKELSEIENNINNNENTIKRNSEKIEELKAEKKKLEAIDITSINKEIEKILKENANLRESVGIFKEKIDSLDQNIKDLNKDYKRLIETNEEKALCWTCNDGYVSISYFENELGKKNLEKENFQNELTKKENSIDNNNSKYQQLQKEKASKDRIEIIEEEYEKLSKTVGLLGAEKDKLGARKKEIDGEIPMHRENIKSREIKIQKKEQQIKSIEEKLVKFEQVAPKLEEKNLLTKKLGVIEKDIEDLEHSINQKFFFEFLGIKIEDLKINTLFKDFEEIFKEVNNYIDLNIKEQSEGAAIKFNDNIKKIIKELEFSEFNEISLNLEDYNLNIIRKDNTIQPINSLSGGEKVVVSSLLQISAKETYNPDIPFIVGDDIILKMDDDRREIFYNYLKNIAKENDWFIILTRTTDEDLIIEEI